MNTNEFFGLKKQLKQGESLVVEFDNTVKICRINKDTGKRNYEFMGKLEDFPNEIVPVKSKLWATPPQPGKQSFYKFGQPLNKRDNNKLDSKVLIGIVLTFKSSAKKYTWEDTLYKFNYDVIEVCGIKVYFHKGNPSFIEFKGQRTYITEKLPELKLEKFPNIESVK